MGEANRTGKTRTPRQAIDPATLHGDARAVKRAISGGADPNATYQRRPLLAIALWTKNKSLIAALIRAGANPIPLDRAPWTWSHSLYWFYTKTIAETLALTERVELDAVASIPKANPCGRPSRI